MPDDKPVATSAHSIQRATRLFWTNVALCACLIPIAFHVLTSAPPAEDKKKSRFIMEVVEPLSLTELAYLKGQVQGLSEHPLTVPEYEVTWVREFSRKEILRDDRFQNQPSEAIKESIVSFQRGYTETYEDYFDDQNARSFGFSYGLKFNPAFHGIVTEEMRMTLRYYRSRIEKDFNLSSEAEWILFKRAFEIGFNEGFSETKSGVTARSPQETIRLFED